MTTMTDTTETITLTTFEAAGFKLRTFMKDGKLWLIGADIIASAGVKKGSMAYGRLAEDEKCLVNRIDLGLPPGRPMVAVSESGFYKLVLRSDKPEAREFQDWVTREVLPAIRRTGGYRLAGVEPEAVEEGVTAEMPDVGGFTALRCYLTRKKVSGGSARPLDALGPHPSQAR